MLEDAFQQLDSATSSQIMKQFQSWKMEIQTAIHRARESENNCTFGAEDRESGGESEDYDLLVYSDTELSTRLQWKWN